MKTYQKWIAVGMAAVVMATLAAFTLGGKETAQQPEEKTEVPMVADAAMYRGSVMGVIAGGSGKTRLLLEQAEGTNYGSPTFTVLITENTVMDCTVDDIVADGSYVEVMYGVSGGAGKPVESENNETPEAISVKLLPPAQFAVFNGTVVSVEGADPGAKTKMSILMKSLSSGEEVLFHVSDETQIYMDEADIKPGAKLNLLERGIRTMSIPGQGSALEIRPYYDAAAETAANVTPVQ